MDPTGANVRELKAAIKIARDQGADIPKKDPALRGMTRMKKDDVAKIMESQNLNPHGKTKDQMINELRGWSPEKLMQTGRVASASTISRVVSPTAWEAYEIGSVTENGPSAVGSENSEGIFAEDVGIDETDYDAIWNMVGPRTAKRRT